MELSEDLYISFVCNLEGVLHKMGKFRSSHHQQPFINVKIENARSDGSHPKIISRL